MPTTTTTISSENNHTGSENNNNFTNLCEIEIKSFRDDLYNLKEFNINSSSSSSSIPQPQQQPRSGGYSYQGPVNNRFILWRTNESQLELSEYHLEHSLEESCIKIYFQNASIINDISIFEYNQKYVIVMLLTSTRVLYRFLFPHPQIIEQNERVGIKRNRDPNIRKLKSIFSGLQISDLENNWSRVKSVIPEGFDISVVRYQSPTKLSVGSSNLGTMWIELSEVRSSGGDISYKRSDFKEGSFLQSFFKTKQESVQDIQIFDHQQSPLVFILQRDNHLRIWSSYEKICFKDFQITTEKWDQQVIESTTTFKRFKIYPMSNSTFLLVLYIEFENESQFQFYTGSINLPNITLKLERFSFIKSRGLIDFNIHNKFLYTLWNNNGTTTLKYIYISNPESESLNMEYNQFREAHMIGSLINEKPVSQDLVEQHYLGRLFNNDQFSTQSIQNALVHYKQGYELQLSVSLESQIQFLIKERIQQQGSPTLTSSTNVSGGGNNIDLDLLYKEWNDFYELCIEYQNLELQGTGLFIEPNTSIIFLIKKVKFKNKTSIMKPMNSTDCLYIVNSEETDYPKILKSCFSTADSQLVHDLTQLFKCCNLITETIENDFSTFEYKLSKTKASHVVLSELQNLMVSTKQQSFSIRFIKLFNSISNVKKVFELILDQLNLEFQNPNDPLIQLQNNVYWSGDLFADILSSSFINSIHSKYSLLRTLSLVLGCISRLRFQLGISPQTIFEIEKDVTPSCRLEFFENIDRQISKLLVVLAPYKDVFLMASYLVEKSQYRQLSELLSVIIGNQMVHNVSPFYYLQGICQVHFSQFTEAYESLVRSSEAVASNQDDMVKICSLSNEELVPNLFIDVPIPAEVSRARLFSNYYMKCIRIFELRSQPEYVIKFCLLNLNHLTNEEYLFDEEELRTKLVHLYSTIFRYALKIPQYDLAFTSAIKNPNPDVSAECKKRLIYTLCETGNISQLCSLPFPQNDVEDIIHRLALSQDLYIKPDYYLILYSYLISRNNYREAAIIIYEKANRILIESHRVRRGTVEHDQLLKHQAMAINTLKLLDESNQWISIDTSHFENPISTPKRKISGINNNNNNSNHSLFQQQQQQQPISSSSDKKIQILWIKDLKKEYTFHLACKALREVADHLQSADTLSPKQVLTELINHGLIDMSITLAIAHEIDLGLVFESFALKCVKIQLNPHSNPFQNQSSLEMSEFQHYNDNVKVAWKVLEKYLEKYDSNPDLECLSPSQVALSTTQGNQVSNFYSMNGIVVNNSLGQSGSFTTFKVSDPKNFFIDVIYPKRVPPFFKEGEPAIVKGRMVDGRFHADKVLSKNGQSRYHELVADTILFEKIDLPNWLIQWFLNGRQEILFKLYFKHSKILDAYNTLSNLFKFLIVQLFGLDPQQILKITEKAIDCWFYQKRLHQQYELSKLDNFKKENEKLHDQMGVMYEEYESKIESLKKQIDFTKKESESDKKEIVELSEKCAEKTRQKRKLEELYESVKKKLEDSDSNRFNCNNNFQSQSLKNTPLNFQKQIIMEEFKNPDDLSKRNHSSKEINPKNGSPISFPSNNRNLPTQSFPPTPTFQLPNPRQNNLVLNNKSNLNNTRPSSLINPRVLKTPSPPQKLHDKSFDKFSLIHRHTPLPGKKLSPVQFIQQKVSK
eukprot:gene6266-7806_t